MEIAKNPIYHIVEELGGIDRMTSVEVPTERYYEALRQDLGARHPKASPFVLDHLLSLEAFFGCFDMFRVLVWVREGKSLSFSREFAREDSRPGWSVG